MDEFRLLGIRVRQLRKKRELTQEELAERCGIHYKFLGGIERGNQNPTLAVLKKIAGALDISLAQLFDYEVTLLDSTELKARLAKGLRKCTDSEIFLLYRIYRSF